MIRSGVTFFRYRDNINGENDWVNTSETERAEVLSAKINVLERILLSSFIAAIFTGTVSVTAWALQNMIVKKKTDRVIKRLNKWMFYQTYIKTVNPHIL